MFVLNCWYSKISENFTEILPEPPPFLLVLSSLRRPPPHNLAIPPIPPRHSLTLQLLHQVLIQTSQFHILILQSFYSPFSRYLRIAFQLPSGPWSSAHAQRMSDLVTQHKNVISNSEHPLGTKAKVENIT